MSSSCETNSPASSLWRKILACFSLEWLILLPDLYQLIQRWLKGQRHEGLYEVLDYNLTLELLDPQGETAIFKKRQQVKFLQNNVIAFEDYAWGDGEIFADYKCSPGLVVDRYQEGDRWNVLISLHETKNSGDMTDFYIERTARHGFTQADESLQIEIRHPTKRLKMVVIFPPTRHCQRAVLVQRSRSHSMALGLECFTNLPDGRQMLTWETAKIEQFEIYTLRWRW
jgi:hypothetical protein